MKKIFTVLAGLSLAASAFAVTGTFVEVVCTPSLKASGGVPTATSAIISDANGDQTVSNCGKALSMVSSSIMPGGDGYYLKDGSATSNSVMYLFTNS